MTSAIDKLLAIMSRLRDPESGCAWDLEQSFETIAPYTIEEAFEVVEAIAARDWPGLREELGDLLLQVVFHARMAEEGGLFDFQAVVATLNEKLVRRHPHVFGEERTRDLADIKAAWEAIKAAERSARGREHGSVLDGVPAGLPALQQAARLQKKAAGVGFDWPDAAAVLPQVRAEIAELEEALAGSGPARVEEELGDVLFTLVNLARHLGADPEVALRRASQKFGARFRQMERLAGERGQGLLALDVDTLEDLWREAKRRLGGGA